jgi:orotate phosphoribosyltransferase
MSSHRYVLSEIIDRCVTRSDEKKFTLSSGAKSNYYIDLRNLTMSGDVMPHIAKLIENALIEEGCVQQVELIGGVTMGADPIAAAYAYHSGCSMFSVRKEIKEHGMQRTIEGPIFSSMRAIIVEDVVTTGGSTLHAISACKNHKLDILGVIPLLDRQEHDYKSLWRKHIPFQSFIRPLFTGEEVKKAWNLEYGREDGFID